MVPPSADEPRKPAARPPRPGESADQRRRPRHCRSSPTPPALEGQGQQALQAGQLVGAARRFLEARIRFERAERAASAAESVPTPAGPPGHSGSGAS